MNTSTVDAYVYFKMLAAGTAQLSEAFSAGVKSAHGAVFVILLLTVKYMSLSTLAALAAGLSLSCFAVPQHPFTFLHLFR